MIVYCDLLLLLGLLFLFLLLLILLLRSVITLKFLGILRTGLLAVFTTIKPPFRLRPCTMPSLNCPGFGLRILTWNPRRMLEYGNSGGLSKSSGMVLPAGFRVSCGFSWRSRLWSYSMRSLSMPFNLLITLFTFRRAISKSLRAAESSLILSFLMLFWFGLDMRLLVICM